MKSLDSKQKLILRWIIIAIVVLAIIFGFRTYVKSVYQKELNKNDTSILKFDDELKSSIEKSTKSAYELTVLGKKMLDNNQNYWATVVLESAAKKDPKYRDAALYAGYGFLKIGDNQKSLEYLLKAQAIDPIYPQTQQLLSIAYKNLGDEEKSTICYNKFIDFAKTE